MVPDPRGFHMLQATKVHGPQLLSLCSRACEPQLVEPLETQLLTQTPGAYAPPHQEALPQ